MADERKGSARDRAYAVLFGGTSRAARIFDTVLFAAILLSVLTVIVESSQSPDSPWTPRLRIVEIAFTLLFSVEYIVRLWCHPRALRFAFSTFGLIDFLSIVPTYLALLFPGLQTFAALRVLRLLRIFRVFRLSRFARAGKVIGNALAESRYRIAAFLVGAVLIAVVVGSLMYMIEGPESGFAHIPAGIYWGIATLTTVGHSELNPLTPAGQVLESLVMILGYGMLAIPVSVITSEIVAEQRARVKILEGEESEQLEYKSSAFYDYNKTQIPETHLFEGSVLKPVAGFLNARGGSLIIGMSDDGEVLGIQADLEAKNWSVDKYVRTLTSRIESTMGSAAAALTTISLKKVQGRQVCVLDVEAAASPTFVKNSKSMKEGALYVRMNNSTRVLEGNEIVKYTARRWA
ncbi:MAG: ion transporter [Gammaproteobacteria bacterium]|nr:ion transporter [Gammaproteobacteria bacterium]